MAAVLIVAGLTGSLLAFLGELEEGFNPQYRVADPPGAVFDPIALREQVLQRMPEVRVDSLLLHREPGQALHLWVELPDPQDAANTVTTALVLNPYTAEEISRRTTSIWPVNRKNLMALVYRLHYSLALGDLGLWLFGVVALVWTVDCFVGAWLTLPSRSHRADSAGRTWWSRWGLAWRVKWRSSAWRVQFDLHRAVGLWMWLILLAFAWSAVSFNLTDQVYKPVMSFLFGRDAVAHGDMGNTGGARKAAMPWRMARDTGVRLMAEQAARHGFVIRREQMLSLDAESGTFSYAVLSDLDVSERWGGTTVTFDAHDGRLLAVEMPTRQNIGKSLTNWITALHTASFWGLPMKLFVCATGIAVAVLSGTGVLLWLRRRRTLAATHAGQAHLPDL